VALHNPARIPVIAELQRQELLAAARHEHLCELAKLDGENAPPPPVASRRRGVVWTLLTSVRMPPLARLGRRAASAG